jgi:hypothetical protein
MDEIFNEKSTATEAAIDHMISRAARCARSAVGGIDKVGSTNAVRTPIVRSATNVLSLMKANERRILNGNIGRKDRLSRSKNGSCCSRKEFLEIVGLEARFCALES